MTSVDLLKVIVELLNFYLSWGLGKLLLNEEKALVTDTLHKVRSLEDIDEKQVAVAFYEYIYVRS